ncbi:ArsR/SmtB family transcription factor [Sphingomonas sp. PR090111-T3T-6A]|uniref:ArsR/SmtB family transcription factor n=1 Tax=Sphingomonas sp. PR090111-T3T-6A TaxID=685778 RepID=UPI000475C1C8|nr:metalloregulator ArsR/SmtB family transcription factor [Sphingomonas sp. PR090111-T3T-6A]
MDEDLLFRALADPVRRMLLDRLRAEPGQALGALVEGVPMSRQAVSKHLAVLEAANLVAVVRRGREKLHYLNPVPIQEIAARWIGTFERERVAALVDLKSKLEGEDGKA